MTLETEPAIEEKDEFNKWIRLDGSLDIVCSFVRTEMLPIEWDVFRPIANKIRAMNDFKGGSDER